MLDWHIIKMLSHSTNASLLVKQANRVTHSINDLPKLKHRVIQLSYQIFSIFAQVCSPKGRNLLILSPCGTRNQSVTFDASEILNLTVRIHDIFHHLLLGTVREAINVRLLDISFDNCKCIQHVANIRLYPNLCSLSAQLVNWAIV